MSTHRTPMPPGHLSGGIAVSAASAAGFSVRAVNPAADAFSGQVHISLDHPDGRQLLLVTAPRGTLVRVVASPRERWPGVRLWAESVPGLRRMLDPPAG